MDTCTVTVGKLARGQVTVKYPSTFRQVQSRLTALPLYLAWPCSLTSQVAQVKAHLAQLHNDDNAHSDKYPFALWAKAMSVACLSIDHDGLNSEADSEGVFTRVTSR